MESRTEMGAYTLAPDITTEQMQAVFFDANALRVPNYKLYQLNTKGARYYYVWDDDGEPRFFPSVTTILGEVSPRNPFLENWRAEMGIEKADAYTQERANYGTFLHASIEKLLVARSYDLDLLKSELAKYIEREQLPTSFINYAEDLKKDVLAFAQFVKDYDIQPLCIEESLYSEKGYAGMIDLVCSMYRFPHEEGKKAKNDERIIAMIDFKSGKNGFYESHIHQLYLYKDMWAENFPEFPIQSVFNWSPKDWRKSPTYNFKCQDDAIDPRITQTLLEQYRLRKTETKEVTLMSGIINLGGNLLDNYKTISLAELIKTKDTEKEIEDDGPLFTES